MRMTTDIEPIRRPCPGLWKTPIVHRNGDVTVCCFDIGLVNRIGNLREMPLYRLWGGELINKWRIAQINGEFRNSGPLCGNCPNLNAPTLSDGEIVRYLKETGREGLIEAFIKRVGCKSPTGQDSPAEMQTIITLEMTDHCNMQCIMCDQSRRQHVHNMPKGHMAFDVWKTLIDSIRLIEGTKIITPYWIGESMLNPDFSRMIRYAFESNSDNALFDIIAINTNGSLLDSEKTELLLQCATLKNQRENTLIRIHFSLDAITPETYRKIKQRSLFQVTQNNLLHFLKRRAELGLKYPLVTLAFIVMEENKGEARQFLDYWKAQLSSYHLPYEVCYDWPELDMDAIYFRRLDGPNQISAEELHKLTVAELGLIGHDKLQARIIKTDSLLK